MPEQNPAPLRERRRRISLFWQPPPEVMDAVISLKQRTKLHTNPQLLNYLSLLSHRLYQHKKAGGKIVLEDAHGGREELKLL